MLGVETPDLILGCIWLTGPNITVINHIGPNINENMVVHTVVVLYIC